MSNDKGLCRSFGGPCAYAVILLFVMLTLTTAAGAHASEKVQIETIEFKSELIGQRLPYLALLPAGYSESNTRYPVLYLLHGLFGRYDNWLTNTNLAEYVEGYKVIVIMPEGHDSWYTDSATVPSDKYESYLMKELIPNVDSKFRTIRDRRARGIAGLSMGGYGALKFALKYPGQFSFAGSISGAFDPAVRSDEHPGFSWDIFKPSINAAFGESGNSTRAANNLHQLARNLTAPQVAFLPYIYFDCGTEDGFLETNRDLDAILLAKKVPHEFRELPGGHDWGYWDRQVRELLRVFAQRTNGEGR